jgi:uncharacterized protein YgiM (DUF1202 family)
MRAAKIFQIFIFLSMGSILIGIFAILIYAFRSTLEPQRTHTPPTPSLEPFLADTLPPSVCVVTSDALNVRMRPNENSTAIYWLVQNDVVTILDDQPVGSWVRVQVNEYTGWINSYYCEKGKQEHETILE